MPANEIQGPGAMPKGYSQHCFSFFW